MVCFLCSFLLIAKVEDFTELCILTKIHLVEILEYYALFFNLSGFFALLFQAQEQ